MRVRGVGINGWIIFRKRITSSLRWAVSHRYVLVITHYTAHNARERLLVCCSTHAIYWLDQNVCMWLYMCLCQCMHVHLFLCVSNIFCVSIENICKSLHTVLHLGTFVQSNVEKIIFPFLCNHFHRYLLQIPVCFLIHYIVLDIQDLHVFFLPASVPLLGCPTWRPRSWRHPQRWHWGFGPWWPPGCLWRIARRPTQVSVARWGPSSSSSFEVWVWASSFLPRPASHCLSGDIKKDGEGGRETREWDKEIAGHKSVDENNSFAGATTERSLRSHPVCSVCMGMMHWLDKIL